MKLFARTFALIAALCAFNANANVFTFSYTFSDSQKITGTLSGDLNGKFVDHISNLHVNFDGTDFTGTLVAAGFDTTTEHFDSALTARLSTDATLNNFAFTDGHGVDGFVDNFFSFFNGPANLGQQVFATNFNTGDAAIDVPANGSWALNAVPEPANWALLLTGLSLISLNARRRNNR